MAEPILLPEMLSAEEMFPELSDAEVRESFAVSDDIQKRLDDLLARYDRRFAARLKRKMLDVEEGLAGRGPKPGKNWQREFSLDWKKAQRGRFDPLLRLARTTQRENAFTDRLEAAYGCKVVTGQAARDILPHTDLRYLQKQGRIRGEFFGRMRWYYAADDLERRRLEDGEGIERRRLAAIKRDEEWRAMRYPT